MALTPAQQATLEKLKARFAVWEYPLEVLEPVPKKVRLIDKMSKHTAKTPGKKLGLKCPNCKDGDQIYRQNRSTGDMFIGCTNFPAKCRWTANLPDNVKYKE